MSRLLVVDDSPTIHRILRLRVTVIGHEVVACASDGNEGAESFSKFRPDLVLMDITMPNCDGREGLRKILGIAPNAKVLMLSAISDPTIMNECLRIGACGFAFKDRLGEDGYLEALIADALAKTAA